MKWNWQKEDWPEFFYNTAAITKFETEFSYNFGLIFGVYKHLNNLDAETLKIKSIANEALKTSEIEGEILNRNSLQSSIRRNFGLGADNRSVQANEQGVADMMVDLYKNFSEKLTHDSLFKWHQMLMNGRYDLVDTGKYRTHNDPMQIASGNLYDSTIHFEAPHSKIMVKEINRFIKWFNDSAPTGSAPLTPLIRSAITHLYFVSIHPFEDGNGRIARALSIKALSQSLKKPLLTSLSTIIQKNKKQYYDALAENNKKNEVTKWIIYFAQTFLKSQNNTRASIEFLITKTKLYQALQNQLNARQEKVLERMFAEGLNGFKGGLSADNYIKITKTSRPTATRDLKDLVNKKALIKTGELKGTRYQLDTK